jgi:hypothetical protein
MKTPTETLLIAAHPGHEVTIWGWLAHSQPRVLIVTDGSGGYGQPRIRRTARNLRSADIPTASTFGDYSDRQIYHYALTKNAYFFEMLVHLMATEMIKYQVRRVVGDAGEGEIMAHDLLREVRRVAVRIAEAELGWNIDHLEIAIEGGPASFPNQVQGQQIIHRLNEDQWKEKIAIAKRYRELRPFVDAALNRHGQKAFQQELFFPCTQQSLIPRNIQPAYEDHGEKMVSQMKYNEVIRFHDHLTPIIQHLYRLLPAGSKLEMPEAYHRQPETQHQTAVPLSKHLQPISQT